MNSPIYLHNTLGNKKEEFHPLTLGEVRMYNCGPTVYNYVHIGNLKAYVFADLLRRMFEYNGYVVNQVMNITDIGHLRSDGDDGEDKMTAALKREGMSINLDSLKKLADTYTTAFLGDLISLNIEAPKAMPRASEHIKEDIDLLTKLEGKGMTYKTSDGIYFDTSKDKDYGKLGQINLATKNESRIGVNPEKRNPQDFAVWKFAEKDQIAFESPWGMGFPGWHIECSAMSMKYLGESFDIHTGGIDHIPIHHNNEIAQSESATGKPYARYWLHNAFINVNNEKIAKSSGNDIYLKEIVEKGFSPLSYRYLILGAHYRTPMNFNWDALQGADTAFKRLIAHLVAVEESSKGSVNGEYKNKFSAYINDDLDTPRALALVWEMIQDDKVSIEDTRATILDFDRVLGLSLQEQVQSLYFKIPRDVSVLMEKREDARKNKEWARADEIRDEILAAGFMIKDTDKGPQLTKI